MTGLTIDGSKGEGGGQIVRSSLALSMVTGQAVRIERVRAGRKKPGLLRQHLTALRAAAVVCGGEVTGDVLGSRVVTLEPGEVRGGDYRFSIGTAGSTTLVLQTVLPALILADGPSRLTLQGGTHNPMAPPFDFLEKAYLPLLNQMGPKVTATLKRPGFFPAGGGELCVEIEPVSELRGIELLDRGEVIRRRAVAHVANLSVEIGKRELKVVRDKLGWSEDECAVLEIEGSAGPGNVLTLEVESAGKGIISGVCEVFTGFGQVGRKSEAVARSAVQQCQRYLRSQTPIGKYLADQLVLLLAIANEGAFLAQSLSRHTSTHIELLKTFLGQQIDVEDHGRDGVMIRMIR